jgi:hypothetical protein
MRLPKASDYEVGKLESKGAYRIMALPRNPSLGTLGEASILSGIPISTL